MRRVVLSLSLLVCLSGSTVYALEASKDIDAKTDAAADVAANENPVELVAAADAESIVAAPDPTQARRWLGMLSHVQHANAIDVLSAAYVGVSVLDWSSTTQAIASGGARELNPVLAPIVRESGALLAARMALAGTFVYSIHRLSTQHRVAALAIVSAATAAQGWIVAHNYALAGYAPR